MPNVIDDTGFTKLSYQDLRVEKAAEFVAEFGTDIKTDVDSAFGQMISISAQAEDELSSIISLILSNFDPNSVNGVQLSRLAIIMNKKRSEAVKSTVTMDITTDASGATVPIGFIVANSSGVEFQTTTSLIIAPSSTGSMVLEAIDHGTIVASSGTLTVIKTPVFGVASVNNAADAIVGRDIENDAQLRARMLQTSANANGTEPGGFTALSEVDGVSFVNLISNNTNVAIASGQPAHTVFTIVEGGTDSDIAKALVTKAVSGGIGYVKQGDIAGVTITSSNYIDPISLQSYTAHFARPVLRRVYCDITVKKLTGYPVDGADRIKAAVNQWVIDNATVGETFYSSFLYTSINTIAGLSITSVFVDSTPSPIVTSVSMGDVEKADIAIIDITVTETV